MFKYGERNYQRPKTENCLDTNSQFTAQSKNLCS